MPCSLTAALHPTAAVHALPAVDVVHAVPVMGAVHAVSAMPAVARSTCKVKNTCTEGTSLYAPVTSPKDDIIRHFRDNLRVPSLLCFPATPGNNTTKCGN